MRAMQRIFVWSVLALFVVACTGETPISNRPTTPTQTELRIEERTDVIVQPPVRQADVLFVVDDSCSMRDDQETLARNIGDMVAWFETERIDYHLGVVSTDPFRNQGVLVRDGDLAWVDPDTPDLIETFGRMAQVGTDGSDRESGLWTAYYAVDLHGRRTGRNEGFFREDASLHTLVISDEDDHTPEDIVGVEPFLAWYQGLREQPDQRTFNLIGNLDDADRYLQVVEGTGGFLNRIDDGSWIDALDRLGRRIAQPKDTFFLSAIPVDGEVDVEVLEQGAPRELVPGLDWTYDAAENAVVFQRFYPAAGSEVRLTYRTEVLFIP